MTANNSIQLADISPRVLQALLLNCLQEIDGKFNRIDALAFTARRAHEANKGDDDYDPTDGRLFEIIGHEVQDRAALNKLRAELERLLPVQQSEQAREHGRETHKSVRALGT